jgi:hypothetical protein
MPNLSTTPSLYALLIGIDCYLPNRLPDGSYYRNLTGCVRDILHVEGFLRRKLGMESANILKLTASNSGTAEPSEPREFWPTYRNIVGAFAKLAKMAKPGDQVYIHYSGHGGRCAALIPELKTNGLDEVLVPTDLGNSETRYVRDIEIARLLQTLFDNQLLVTLVLDSCHSAGATRAAGMQNQRSIGSIDPRPPVKDSLVASLDDLASNWKRMQAAVTRNVSANSGWVPGTRDYVLLAACRANEAAFEYAFDGKEANGALTYWLLNSMEEMGLGLTYNQLNDRIVAKVHSQFETQTPQLEGDGTRVVFGSEHLQPTYTAMVMQVDEPNHRVVLNAGQAHGIRKGAEFAIYSQLEADVTKVNSRLGIARVEQLGATDSWSSVMPLSTKPIEQGAQAVLINPGAVKLLRKVRVTPPNRNAEALIHAIRESAWLESAVSNEAVDYEVTIAETGTYQIKNRVGITLSNQTPEITVDDPNGVARLIQRLEHITRYQAIQELDNYDPTSPLAGKLQVDWAGYQDDYERGEKIEPVPFATPGDTPSVTVGRYVFLRVKNLSATVLNVMVLNLQPDWGIAQVHPAPPSWFASFDPGQEHLIPFDVNLPGGYSQGRDVMKVFATVGTANFRWLQLPPLDHAARSMRRNGDWPLSPLDLLLATISSELPASRNLVPAAHPSAEWTTAQVAIEVHRV